MNMPLARLGSKGSDAFADIRDFVGDGLGSVFCLRGNRLLSGLAGCSGVWCGS